MAIEVDLSKPLSAKEIKRLRGLLPSSLVDRYIDIANGDAGVEDAEPEDEQADESDDQESEEGSGEGQAEDEGQGDAEDDSEEDEEEGDLYDPTDHNVGDVQEYLLTASEEEAERVLTVERAGKNRSGIVGG